jgi:nitric oxide reductase NorF protein
METHRLFAAWAALMVLSFCTAMLTMLNWADNSPVITGAGVLLLAGGKARVILVRYLNLHQSRFWRGIFDIAVGAFLAMAFTIFWIGSRG